MKKGQRRRIQSILDCWVKLYLSAEQALTVRTYIDWQKCESVILFTRRHILMSHRIR
jgi:hypothetical protein